MSCLTNFYTILLGICAVISVFLVPVLTKHGFGQEVTIVVVIVSGGLLQYFTSRQIDRIQNRA